MWPNISLKRRLFSGRVGVVIFNRRPDFEPGISYLVIGEDSWMEAQKKICDHFYPIDWKSKKMIGITGTNGKTTTVHLVLKILDQIGEHGFSVGSLGVCDVSGKLEDLRGMTTPPYIELRKILFRNFKNHNFCAMEVSSHGLAEERVYKILYDAGGWTNFSQDHLDYHRSLEDYFQQKLKFPKYHIKEGKSLLIPASEKELAERLSHIPIRLTNELKSFGEREKTGLFSISFNKENLKMAATLVKDACEKKDILINTKELTFPPGRVEVIEAHNKLAIVDSAHTPDAMRGVLEAIRESFPNRKVITIFGCGGERDRSKRPLMGQMAEKNSDITIVTSDNPRSENQEDIIDEIVDGMTKFDYRQGDRSEAIALGVSLLTDQSVLVILGKGAETYQIIGSEKRVFSDRDEFYQCVGRVRA